MKTFCLFVLGLALAIPAHAHAESPAPSTTQVYGVAASHFKAPRTMNPARLNALARHPDARARIHAAEAIANMRRSQTVRAARVLLRDPDVAVRRALLRSVGSVPSRFWFPILSDGLTDGEPLVRLDALQGLRSYPNTEYRAAAATLLRDPSPQVRQEGDRGLLTAGPEGLEVLIGVETGARELPEPMRGEVDVTLRKHAAGHGAEIAGAIIIDDVGDDAYGRVAGLLASCGPQGARILLAEMERGLTQKAFLARRALEANPHDAVVPITSHLLRVDLTYTKSALITVYLDILETAADPDAVPGLARLLTSERPYLRAEAARVLGAMSDSRSIELLMDAAGDSEPNVRAEVATALGRRKAPAAVKPLIRMVAADGPETIRAIQALGVIGDPAAALVIHRKLSSASPHVRRHACEALERIGHPSSVALLKARLDDSDAMVRYTASRALASFQ